MFENLARLLDLKLLDFCFKTLHAVRSGGHFDIDDEVSRLVRRERDNAPLLPFEAVRIGEVGGWLDASDVTILVGNGIFPLGEIGKLLDIETNGGTVLAVVTLEQG